ncbi:hypothetical protein ACFQV2_16130 [Actinokineospora soli]|uniref:Uncharacterized protein n=1 Tax=Actinokineospora soli TaxID=1048753 RepID=A0ABW2TP84_9PSEU
MLSAPEVDAQHSWCVALDPGFRCGGAVAEGDLLVVVEATAGESEQAGDVVSDLFPAALRGIERVGVRATTAPRRRPPPPPPVRRRPRWSAGRTPT